jgi:eukaryotic-like serine/threonine-protein kinase
MTEPGPNEKSIFLRAIEIESVPDRVAFVDAACGGDPVVRAAVEGLLAAHERPAPLLDAPDAIQTTVDAPAAEPAGTTVGPYKLVEVIGEGGMGTVYLAQQQEPVRRIVALKVIKAGMDSKQVLARFEAERQALALMDHPNIAKVLDAGATADGRPFFAMELVKGVPITDFCDQNRLTPRQRLELFVPVCQAVQHAHQKGVIHRDLKPSNVMVALYDSDPVPKVIDFGVAKAAGVQLTEETVHTTFGAVVGTVEYMSPEQATLNQLDVDTRSDIYSLGVLLYELLTGSTPLERNRTREKGILEALRIIREEEPPTLSDRLSVTKELPAIAANRGTDPARLARLVWGELNWIVMKALEKDRSRRYETANGLALDVQRYLADEPVLACPPSTGYRLRKFARRNKGGVAVAGLGLVFLVLLGNGAGWALRDRAARQSRTAAQADLILADVDQLEAEQKWPDALAAARRAEAAVAGGQADAATVRRVRERLKALEFIDQLEQIRMRGVAVVNRKLNQAGADREYGQAFRDYGVDVDELAIETSVDRLKARPALAIPLGAALDNWAGARRMVSVTNTAGWQRLLAIARGIDPEPLRDRLRATAGQPVTPEVGENLRRLAESIDVRGQHPSTLVSLARSLARAKHTDSALRILGDARLVYPDDFWLNFELGDLLKDDLKDPAGALRFYTAGVSIRPNSPVANTYLGSVLLRQGKADEAVACFRRGMELDPKYYWPVICLGDALDQQRKYDDAVAAYRKALELNPGVPFVHHKIGDVLSRQRKFDDAIAAYRAALELNPKSGPVYLALGRTLTEQGKLDDAVAAYRKGIEFGPTITLSYGELGNALSQQGKLDEAVANYRKAIELSPKYAPFYYGLGSALWQQGKWDEAIPAYKKAVALAPQNAGCHNGLAWLLATCPDARFRDPGQAVALAKKAVQLAPNYGTYANTLGVAHYRAGDWQAAVAALDRSMELRNGGDSLDWFFLAMAHWQLGEKDKAREWYDRAVQWMDKNRPTDEELRRFRAEAAELLKQQEKN